MWWAGRCEVHVFDPTLTEEQRKQVAAIHGLTLHDYGLGVKDGQVSRAFTSCSRVLTLRLLDCHAPPVLACS